MTLALTAAGLTAALTLFIFSFIYKFANDYLRDAPRLPPGPKRLPFFGNIRDLPAHGSKEWEHWAKHKELYGIVHLQRCMMTWS